MSFAAMISPSEMTGRSTIRFTPTMATSGRLMRGVDIIPPSGPKEVSVIVEPVSSDWVAVPSRVELERRDISAASCQMLRRSEEHTSELQSLLRISYAVFCLKKKSKHIQP